MGSRSEPGIGMTSSRPLIPVNTADSALDIPGVGPIHGGDLSDGGALGSGVGGGLGGGVGGLNIGENCLPLSVWASRASLPGLNLYTQQAAVRLLNGGVPHAYGCPCPPPLNVDRYL